MCGRYSLTLKGVKIENEVDEVAIQLKLFKPRYNVAPGQDAPVIRLEDGHRRVATLRWGLIPGWSKDAKIAFQCINARSETVASKPAFRSAFKRRRCLVPADGFYEWQAVGSGKQPWRFTRSDDGLMEFAGLWEQWTPPEGGSPLETFTVCTTTPNAVTGRIHDRMPVILDAKGASEWLNPETSPEALALLLKPASDELLKAYPVSTVVSNARNDVPECVRPIPEAVDLL